MIQLKGRLFEVLDKTELKAQLVEAGLGYGPNGEHTFPKGFWGEDIFQDDTARELIPNDGICYESGPYHDPTFGDAVIFFESVFFR